MGKERLVSFSDGVIAIIITIMVLELKVPHGASLHVLRPLIPVFLSYLLSFIFVAVYWNNHHHLYHAIHHVSGSVLWANLHLLFWLSLIPFVTGWMGENHFAPTTAALYGFVLLMCAIAYWILTVRLLKLHGHDSTIARALGNDFKGKLSILAYVIALPLAFVHEGIAMGIYILVTLVWLIPDRRIEKALGPTRS